MNDNYKKLIFGVGVNDADYQVSKYSYTTVGGKTVQTQEWICPYYLKWHSLLQRLYSSIAKTSQPTYSECSVCEEWLLFSNFKAWVVDQPEVNWEYMQLDKDLLVEGNKVYSPETCVFISRTVNTFIRDSFKRSDDLPTGVTRHTSKTSPFMGRCKDPLKRYTDYLGVFKTEEEAHSAWVKQKHQYAKDLACLQADERVRDALSSRYQVGMDKCEGGAINTSQTLVNRLESSLDNKDEEK